MVVVVVVPPRYEEEGCPRGTCCEPKAGFPRAGAYSCAPRGIPWPHSLFFVNGLLQLRGRGQGLKLVGINSPPFAPWRLGGAEIS